MSRIGDGKGRCVLSSERRFSRLSKESGGVICIRFGRKGGYILRRVGLREVDSLV